MFDLQAAICKNEGIETFEELELGPFLRHPLVLHYFSVNKDIGVYKITTEEIVLYLSEFFNGRKRKNVKIEEFLDFIAKKSDATSWQQLGLRIQSLGYVPIYTSCSFFPHCLGVCPLFFSLLCLMQTI